MNRVLTDDQISFYKKNGYLVIKNFLSEDEVKKFKEGCRARLTGDTACHPEYFDYITISPRVVNIIKGLIGTKVHYPGLSFTRTEDFPKKFGSRKLHSDAAYENNVFSKERKIVNTGFYLQDQTNYSGCLKVIPGSQDRPREVIKTVGEGLKKSVKYILKGEVKKAFALFDVRGIINVDSEARDLVIWSTRVHHAGFGLRFKWFPKLSLLPVLEDWIPSFLHIPNNPERDVILTIYGAPGEEFENYMDIQKRKAHRKNHFLASNFDREDTVEKAKESGVILRNDGYEYASDPESKFVVRTTKRLTSGDH